MVAVEDVQTFVLLLHRPWRSEQSSRIAAAVAEYLAHDKPSLG